MGNKCFGRTKKSRLQKSFRSLNKFSVDSTVIVASPHQTSFQVEFSDVTKTVDCTIHTSQQCERSDQHNAIADSLKTTPQRVNSTLELGNKRTENAFDCLMNGYLDVSIDQVMDLYKQKHVDGLHHMLFSSVCNHAIIYKHLLSQDDHFHHTNILDSIIDYLNSAERQPCVVCTVPGVGCSHLIACLQQKCGTAPGVISANTSIVSVSAGYFCDSVEGTILLASLQALYIKSIKNIPVFDNVFDYLNFTINLSSKSNPLLFIFDFSLEDSFSISNFEKLFTNTLPEHTKIVGFIKNVDSRANFNNTKNFVLAECQFENYDILSAKYSTKQELKFKLPLNLQILDHIKQFDDNFCVCLDWTLNYSINCLFEKLVDIYGLYTSNVLIFAIAFSGLIGLDSFDSLFEDPVNGRTSFLQITSKLYPTVFIEQSYLFCTSQSLKSFALKRVLNPNFLSDLHLEKFLKLENADECLDHNITQRNRCLISILSSFISLILNKSQISSFYNVDHLVNLLRIGYVIKLLDTLWQSVSILETHDGSVEQIFYLLRLLLMCVPSLHYCAHLPPALFTSAIVHQLYLRLSGLSPDSHEDLLALLRTSRDFVTTICALQCVNAPAFRVGDCCSDVADMFTWDYIYGLKDPRTVGQVLLVSARTSPPVLCLWDVDTRLFSCHSACERVKRIDHLVVLPATTADSARNRCILISGRDVFVYNITDGIQEHKLPIILNSQMIHCCGVHDCSHVVALSRDRMHISLINTDSACCLATFKAGEDRFLNSLVVSSSGKICACVDETPIPSPLLVWNLCSRKLQYDFRMPYHKFISSDRRLAFSSDDHYLFCCCVEEESVTFIVAYDMNSGTLFRRFSFTHSVLRFFVHTQSHQSSQSQLVLLALLGDARLVATDTSSGKTLYEIDNFSGPSVELEVCDHHFVVWNRCENQCLLDCFSLDTGEHVQVFSFDSPVKCVMFLCQLSRLVVCTTGRKMPAIISI